MRVVHKALSDVGRERKLNEDSFLADPELSLFVVCDGMGGHAAGEVASRMTVDTLREFVAARKDQLAAIAACTEPPETAAQILRDAIALASDTIYALGVADRAKKGMGTTCSAMLVVGTKGIIGHVGDSRVYLVRGGELFQLSEDHTFLEEAIKHGVMSREQAKQSIHANIITRAVGPLEKVIVDTLVMDLLPDDTFLLCSDGLHNYVNAEEELVGMLSASSVDGLPAHLIDLANERGGADNITAVTFRTESDEPASDRATLVTEQFGTLRHIELFEEMTMPELLRVANVCKPAEFAEGDVIIREDDATETLFLIVRGEVTVERNGNVLTTLDAGSHFGEMALLSRRPRSASVRAKTATHLLALERTTFHSLMQQESAIASKFLFRLAQSLSLRLDDLYMIHDEEDAKGSVPVQKIAPGDGGGAGAADGAQVPAGANPNKTTLRFGLYPSPFAKKS